MSSSTPARAPRRACLAITALALGLAGPAFAEDTALTLGPARTGSLAAGETDVYVVAADAGQFVQGVAMQKSVDVVIVVIGPDGTELGRFDGPGAGPETFQFDTEAAGAYRVEVRPFEDAAGDYSIELLRLEPQATTPEARVDQLMAAYDHAGTPGGVVGVIRDGRLDFARAYGTANLADGVPFTLDTRTNIGSTAKQFTAFAILLLAERGALSLDDEVRAHVPELPEFDHAVTLRHLLTHTSGYREFLNTLALTGRRLDRGDHIDRAEIIAIIQRQPELQNVPGAEWNYNNSGYGLLATVVERVSGEDFPAWMAANVFRPLGMEDTFVRAHPGEIIARRALGYTPDEADGFREAADLGGAMGAGGIYTTPGDLARWMGNLADGAALGGPAIIESMTTPYVLADGESTGYGLGLFLDEHHGLRRVHHGGADTAHRSAFMYFPEIDAGVVVLSNHASFDGSIADRVAAAFFEADMTLPEEAVAEASDVDPSTFDPATFDADTLDDFAGRFAPEEMPQFVITFTREGDEFFTQAPGQPKLRLVPTSATTFEISGAPVSLTFHREGDGTVKTLTLHQNGDHLCRRLEAEAWTPDAAALAACAGRYFSEELETFYTITVEGDRLHVSHRRYPESIPLTPTEEHRFTGAFPISTLDFEVDDAGAITGLVVGAGRARGIRFAKVE